MNAPPVDNNVEQTSQDFAEKSQYGVSPVVAHTHNGTDSLPVSFANIADRTFFDSYTIQGTSAATSSNYSVFFIAPMPITILGFKEVHAVKGSDGSAVTLQVEKLTGTTSPGSGTVILTSSINLKANNNTVQTGTLVSLRSTKNLATGDRLALKVAGTLTSLTNVTVSVYGSF